MQSSVMRQVPAAPLRRLPRLPAWPAPSARCSKPADRVLRFRDRTQVLSSFFVQLRDPLGTRVLSVRNVNISVKVYKIELTSRQSGGSAYSVQTLANRCKPVGLPRFRE